MRGLTPFAWLSRWLDRRIDARIAAREARTADRLVDGFRRIREARSATAIAAPLPGHLDLTTFAVEAIRDCMAAQAGAGCPNVEHGLTPAAKFGLSVEHVPLDRGHWPSDWTGPNLPVGSPFVKVVALEGEEVLLATGCPMPDNGVSYNSRTRLSLTAAISLAVALLRAVEISDRAASTAQARAGEHSNQAPHAEPSERALRGAP